MDTLYHHFETSARTFGRRIAVETIRRHGVESTDYTALLARTELAARVLRRAGVAHGDRCAILADNDADWCTAYLGILQIGAIAVPLDTAYRAHQVRSVVQDCGARMLCTSRRYLDTAREAVEALTTPPGLALVAGHDPGVLALAPVEPDTAPLPPCPAQPSDTAIILYTSGTTSDPKGVMLTNANMMAERRAAFRIVNITEQDALLGILPLFHALAQVANLLIPLTVGARVVFLETVTSADMVRALSERGITAFCVVPQFYYLMHQRVLERVAALPWWSRRMFRTLVALNRASRRWLRLNLGRVLLGRVHAAVGPSMRILVTGGSRFDPRIGRDLFDMGFNIIQAYGLTECAGACTATRPGDPRIESVGQALDGVEIRIGAPDPASERGDGEVFVRGPIVMSGYYNKPEVNAVTLQDGWLHTGDLGYLDDRNRLHLTGRKKENIVLASGKNIYPEEIEAVYLQSPLIKELCVLGVSRPDEPAAERLHAVIVPNLDLMRERRVVNMREVIRFDVEGLSLQLPSHKRVLSFELSQDDLPRTTTRKLKRHAIEQACAARASATAAPVQDAVPVSDDAGGLDNDTARRVLEVVRRSVRPGTVVRASSHLELDLGFDSMERVEVLTAVEHTLGVALGDDAAPRIFTVQDLVSEARQAATRGPESDVELNPWDRLLAPGAEDPTLAYLLRPRPFYTPLAFLVFRLLGLFARLCWGLRTTGASTIAADGPFLICPNHQSYLDAFVLAATIPYRTVGRLFFVGAAEYFDTPARRAFARLINLVPVDPDAHLVHAMQAGAFGLRHGKVLVLFPEGERSPDGTVRAFKKGAAILATQIGVPVVPVAIYGVSEIWPRGASFSWRSLLPFSGHRARVAYGAPLAPEALEAGASPSAAYASLTARLREAVCALWDGLAAHGRLQR